MNSMVRKILKGLILGIVLLMIFGALFRCDELWGIYVDFYSSFDWRSLLSWVVSAMVTGFYVGRTYGHFKGNIKKEQ